VPLASKLNLALRSLELILAPVIAGVGAATAGGVIASEIGAKVATVACDEPANPLVTVQVVAVPEHPAPLQPANTAPGGGTSVSVTGNPPA
jgi:hypothetical protein